MQSLFRAKNAEAERIRGRVESMRGSVYVKIVGQIEQSRVV